MAKQPPNPFRPAKPAGESPGVYLDMESREVKADWGPHVGCECVVRAEYGFCRPGKGLGRFLRLQRREEGRWDFSRDETFTVCV